METTVVGVSLLSQLPTGELTTDTTLSSPSSRLAFELRDGDFLVGDNQGFIHGMSAMENASDDAEAIWYVFYSRENLRHAESWDCEQCRRSFMRWAKDNLKHKGSGKPTWNGIWAGMWVSSEWDEYKEGNGMSQCTNTHYNFSSNTDVV